MCSIRWQCYPRIHGPCGNRRFRYAPLEEGPAKLITFSVAFQPIALFGKAFQWRCTGVYAIVGMVGLRCKAELFVAVYMYLCVFVRLCMYVCICACVCMCIRNKMNHKQQYSLGRRRHLRFQNCPAYGAFGALGRICRSAHENSE
jgi:hypothetical protein